MVEVATSIKFQCFRNLNDLVQNGNLREDLYYRFTENHIRLHSLKERASEIIGSYARID